ncbi:MAG: ParB/RepB/Spo0J family partition protein [Acidithiobacillus sp.]
MAKIKKDDVMESLAFALQEDAEGQTASAGKKIGGRDSENLLSGLFLKLDEITPDPNQPRRLSDEVDEDLELLAASILRHGVIQPITVRRVDGGFQIVTGERRWRASQHALSTAKKCERHGYDLSRIPAVLVEPQSDMDRLEMQMVENLARADMSPLDTAYALQSLSETQKVSQEELGRRLGRSRTWINQMLSKVHPDALALIDHLKIDASAVGQNELVRLMGWWRDVEGKRAIFADLKERVSAGIELKRTVIDEAEEIWTLRNGLGLQDRSDLTIEQLREAQDWVSSSDAAKRLAFQNLKSGMSSEQALRAAYRDDLPDPEESVEPHSDAVGVLPTPDHDEGAADTYPQDEDEEDSEPEFSGPLSTVAADAVSVAGQSSVRVAKPTTGTETHGMEWEAANASGVSSAARALDETGDVMPEMTVSLSHGLLSRLFQKAGRHYHPLQNDVADVLEVLEVVADEG